MLYFFLDIHAQAENAINHSDIEKIAEKIGKDSYRSYSRQYIQNAVKEKYPRIYETLMIFEEASKNLREKANHIKHQASFWVDGLHINIIGVLSKKRNGMDINLTEIVVPPNINIYAEIASLIEFHNKLVDLEIALFNELSYETKVSGYLKNLG